MHDDEVRGHRGKRFHSRRCVPQFRKSLTARARGRIWLVCERQDLLCGAFGLSSNSSTHPRGRPRRFHDGPGVPIFVFSCGWPFRCSISTRT